MNSPSGSTGSRRLGIELAIIITTVALLMAVMLVGLVVTALGSWTLAKLDSMEKDLRALEKIHVDDKSTQASKDQRQDRTIHELKVRAEED